MTKVCHKGSADEMKCSGFTWMRCTLRRQTAGVAEATLRFVDDERTAQTREDGGPNESVLPRGTAGCISASPGMTSW